MPSNIASGQQMAHRKLPDTFNGDVYTLHSKTSNPTRVEDAGLGYMHDSRLKGYLHSCMGDPQLTKATAERPALKGFSRSASNGEIALLRPDTTALTKAATEARPNSRSRRRQSIREPKTISGLGSLQNSPSKRYVEACLSPFVPIPLKYNLEN